MTLTVVPLPCGPSVPDLLRELADGMDDGTYDMPNCIVYVFESADGQYAGSLGNVDAVRASGLFMHDANFMWQEATD